MLIADEVQSGMGLTGHMWACQHAQITPDVICFGKKAQVCGIMVTDRVDEVTGDLFQLGSRINSTWGGNLVDMVRSTEVMEIVHQHNLVAAAGQMGAYLLSQLHLLAAESPTLVSNVRGQGLMCAFDLPDAAACHQLLREAYQRQLLIISGGTRSIRLRPLLDVTRAEIDHLTDILRQCLKDICLKDICLRDICLKDITLS